MNLNDLFDSEVMQGLIDWKIRNKFHDSLNQENVDLLLCRGVFSQEVMEYLNQDIQEHLKPGFEQFLKTPEVQQVADLVADDFAEHETDKALPQIINDSIETHYTKIYLRQRRLIPWATFLEWDRKVQLSNGTTGTVGMKFFERVVEPVWSEAGDRPGEYLKDCVNQLKDEFSEEEFYKVWCFKKYYKEQGELRKL
ncbi:hypothetical protein HYR99_27255 [Candidatus Poribacteria bacterium]|nr:hypothetical protein [Candidatus Poribacteria bacterium]